MQRILVTGGTGILGSEIIPRLVGARYTVRVMSRSASQLERETALEWAQADLATGEGLSRAVRDVDIILHMATSPFKQTYDVDIEGAHTLLEYARRAGVRHVVHLSLVGADAIEHPYFQHKRLSEQVVEESGVPYTIVRSTHFHNMVDNLLKPLRRWVWSPLLFVPTDFQFQPIDLGEVADHLMGIVAAPPAGRTPDIGGPEVLRLGEMARLWLRAQGIQRPLLPDPTADRYGSGFREGYNTVPTRRVGAITWGEWVAWKYSQVSLPLAFSPIIG
jgi:uncharacterized protein YbjT (DUF2867 family)